MACVLVPLTEAVVTTIATKAVKNHEQKAEVERHLNSVNKIALSRKLKWLSNLLYGGSALLAFEHIWHGEIVPFFPFLTADMAEVLREMATTGTAMSVLVTAVWAGIVALSSSMAKREELPQPTEE